MSVTDITQVIVELVKYCVPAAFVINLTGYGVRVIIDACTGKGLRL